MLRTASARAAALLGSATLLVLAMGYWTQAIAARLAFQPALGEPWLELKGRAVYHPWAWLIWAERYYDRAPAIFDPAVAWSGFMLAAVTLALLILMTPPRKPSTAHGSARWAETHELEKAKLVARHLVDGVVLGQTNDAKLKLAANGRSFEYERHGELLVDDSDKHVLMIAPTGEGKGVSVVLPTAHVWRGSVVFLDVKGELWEKSAGWRRKFSRCLKYEPCSRGTLRFNPLLEVRKETEIADVQNIADILVDPSGSKTQRSHWDISAAALLVGTILHVLYTEDRKTLRRVAEVLSDPERELDETLAIMRDTPHLGDRPHGVVARCAQAMLNKADKERSSIVSSALACLSLWEDDVIDAATSESDFRIADITGCDAPTSLYLVIPPGDLIRTAPLSRLVIALLGRRLVESLERPKHRLLFLLDEFPTLGRLDFFESALAFVRGYGIKCLLIIQSLSQLAKLYGERTSIMDNCQIRVVFAPNKTETAREISEQLGPSTHRKAVSRWRRLGFGSRAGRIDNEQEHARPLLTVGEVIQLPKDEAILLLNGVPPYRAKKIAYYADQRFCRRDQIPPPRTREEQIRELPPPRKHDWLPSTRGGTRSKGKSNTKRSRPGLVPSDATSPRSGKASAAGAAAAQPPPAPALPAAGRTTATGTWLADGIADGAALLAQYQVTFEPGASTAPAPGDDGPAADPPAAAPLDTARRP